MSRVALLLFVSVLVTLSYEIVPVASGDNHVKNRQYNAKFDFYDLSTLNMFERNSINKILLRACSADGTRLLWKEFNKNKSLITSFQENGYFYDTVLLDVSCKSGMKIIESLINGHRYPDSFPKVILTASNNSVLSPIIKKFDLEGKFLADGVAIAALRTPQLPSVLRVAIPDEKMLTDPAGAIIATKLLAHLRDYLKLTFSFRRGNYSDVVSGNADLVADAVSMDGKFMDRVAFLGRQIWRLRSVVIMKNPGFLWDTDALLIPFSTEVWHAVGATILATAFVLRSVTFWESRHVNAHPESQEENSWSFSLMTAMGMMCAQGFTCTTKWSAGRITLVVFEVLSLFVGLFYSSSMVTFLLTLPNSKINSAPDLVNWPLNIAVDPTYYNLQELAQSKDATVRTVMSVKGETMSLWDALSVATEQPVAFLSEEHLSITAAGATLEVSMICRLATVLLRPDLPLALVGSKSVLNPWLLERFRRAMVHVAEIGMLSGDIRRAAARPLICLQSDVTDTEAIAFRAIWPGVAMLAIGHILAIVILVMEIAVDAWYRSRPKHTKSA